MIRFLKIAEKHNLYFKQSKYDFNIEKIPILGIIVSKGQVQMEQDKVKAVKKQKMPMKIKEVESFLGFANFYQRFIQNFSHTAKPLNGLKGKKEQKWKEEHQQAFNELKYKITSQLVLSLLKREGKFRVENGCLRTCHWRDVISRTGREMETNSLLIQDNVTSKKKLRNL